MQIVEILDNFTYVINKGLLAGVRKGQKCYIYIIGKEIIDPNSGEKLGYLEIPKAYCTVTHAQDNMSVIQSDDAPSPLKSIWGLNIKLGYDYFERNMTEDIKKIMIGDYVKIVYD